MIVAKNAMELAMLLHNMRKAVLTKHYCYNHLGANLELLYVDRAKAIETQFTRREIERDTLFVFLHFPVQQLNWILDAYIIRLMCYLFVLSAYLIMVCCLCSPESQLTTRTMIDATHAL